MQLTKEDLLKECLLTRKQAAEFLGVKEHTLAVWACNKRYTLPYVKVGRLVKYRYSDLLAFVEARTENIQLPDEL
ncbi:MAG: helix-turn-helix domain-containing protein [Rickettsiales bacterium]